VTIERWLDELDLLEALDQDEGARRVVLRMGRLADRGELRRFTEVVRADPQLDTETKAWVLRMAENERFLLAAHGYAERLTHAQ